MLKYVSYDIVFQEIPNEITLAVNISGCPNRCQGCHSPWLWENKGEILDQTSLEILLKQYAKSITCICFMGGDADPEELVRLARFIRQNNPKLKTAWYSGCENIPVGLSVEEFDFIKLGGYVQELGGVKSPQTNQRFYRIENKKMTDISELFLDHI